MRPALPRDSGGRGLIAMRMFVGMMAISVIMMGCTTTERAVQATSCQVQPLRSLGNDTMATVVPPTAERVPWQLGAQFKHVVVIMLENKNYHAVLADEYFRQLAHRGALLTHYFANFRPSYPNYLAMVAGDYLGTTGNTQRMLPPTQRSIVDLLEGKGLSWRQYAQGYVGRCNKDDGGIFSSYRRKHVPLVSFANVMDNPERCINVVAASEFDWTQLPNYAFYSPDMCNSGHDFCGGGQPWSMRIVDGVKTILGNPQPRIRQTARWLESFLAPVLADPSLLRNTLVVITFDEGGGDPDNRVYTVMLGGAVKAGQQVTQCASHYNVLRTIEENFGLGTVGAGDERAAPLVDAF